MSQKSIIKAIAVFSGKKIKGTVSFTEDMKNDRIFIDIDIQGLKKNAQHGFHVHEYGDMSEQCDSMCSHFNPFHKNHGAPDSTERHLGDLGNLQTDEFGNVKYRMTDSMIKVRGFKSNIIGRGLIIHENADDLGVGNNKASLDNENAGKSSAWSVIG